MKDIVQNTSSICNIQSGVDLTVVSGKKKNQKRRMAVLALCAVAIVVLVGYTINSYMQEQRFRKELLEVAISVTSEYGVNDLAIVSVNNTYPKTVVFESDMFADISDEEKLKIFRAFNCSTGACSGYFNCEDEGRIIVISDEIRFTAKISEYGQSHYRYLYADGDNILADVYTSTTASTKPNKGISSGKKCNTCNGTGKVVLSYGKSWLKSHPELKYGSKCPDCGGTGYR